MSEEREGRKEEPKDPKMKMAVGLIVAAIVFIIGWWMSRPRPEPEPEKMTVEEVEQYTEDLKSGDDSARQKAVGALAGEANPETVDALIRALSDETTSITGSAVRGLIKIGDPAVGPLIEEMKSEFASVRNLALTALMEITGEYFGTDYEQWKAWETAGVKTPMTPPRKTTIELIQKLLNAGRDGKSGILKQLGVMKNDAACTAIIEELSNKNMMVRKYAAEALGEQGTPRAVEALTARYITEDVPVMESLERALLKTGMPGVEALAGLLTSKEGRVKYYAAQSLEKRLESDFKENYAVNREAWKAVSDEGIELLTGLLDEELEGVRAFAAEILGRTGNPKAILPLIAYLDKKLPVQRGSSGAFIGHKPYFEVLRALGNLKAGKARMRIFEIWKQLKETNRSRRYGVDRNQLAAAFALAAIDGDQNGLDFLRDALEMGVGARSGQQGYSQWAAHLLVELGEPAVMPLIRALSGKQSRGRAYAAWALSVLGEKEGVKPIIGILKDEDRYVRVSACQALGRLGDAQAVDGLIELVNNEEESYITKKEAARALGLLGDKKAVPHLIQALKERTELRYAAHYALKKITGRDERVQSYENWKKWFDRTGGE